MESKILWLRVRVLTILFNDWSMAGFFPQFAFPFPPSILLTRLLKVLPPLTYHHHAHQLGFPHSVC